MTLLHTRKSSWIEVVKLAMNTIKENVIVNVYKCKKNKN